MDINSTELYQTLLGAILNKNTFVVLPKGYSAGEVAKTLRLINRQHPKLFYLTNTYRVDSKTGILFLSYLFPEEKIRFFHRQIEHVIEEDFQVGYVGTLSQLQQIEYIFKWLIHHTNYNYYSAFNQTILSVLVMRNSLCTGYAKAVKYLCDTLGIESQVIFGQLQLTSQSKAATDSKNRVNGNSRHCWNLVRINGRWYHLDVCLGDRSVLEKLAPESPLLKTEKDGYCWGTFCVSNEEILKTHSIEEGQDIPSCEITMDPLTIPRVDLQPCSCKSLLGCQISTAGSSSRVYLDRKNKDRVVKVVHPEESNELVFNEVNSYNTLNGYENILRYYSSRGNEIVLEQATPLTNLFKSDYLRLTAQDVFSMLLVYAETVKHCFDKGLAYRDIHIGNIFVRKDGRWLIGDFGHCVPVNEGDVYPDRVGNKEFMSPLTLKTGFYDKSCAANSLLAIFKLFSQNHYFIENPSQGLSDIISYDGEDKLEKLIEVLLQKCHGIRSLDIESVNGQSSSRKNILYVNWNDTDKSDTSCAPPPQSSPSSKKKDIDDFASTALNHVESSPSSKKKDIDDFATSAMYTEGASLSPDEDIDEFASTGCCIFSPKEREDSCDTWEGKFKQSANTVDDAATTGKFGYTSIPKNRAGVKDSYVPGYNTSDLNPGGDSIRPSTSGNKTKEKTPFFIRITNNLFGKSEKENKKSVSNPQPLERVNSCVYAPAEVKRDDYMLVQVYLYKDEESEQVRIKAEIVDDQAELRHYKPLGLPIKNGDKIWVQLRMRDSRIEVDRKEVYWYGSYTGCEFGVYVPTNVCNTLLGKVNIFINELPAGEMIFKTHVVDAIPSNIFAEVKSQRFDKVFVSYSHNDQVLVRPIVEGLRIANVNYFFDRHTLKPGDKFRDVIQTWIENSDVFVLCWSENAAQSKEVEKEMNIAVQVSQRDKHLRIYPLSIEPKADLPVQMRDTYNFAQLCP